MATLQPALDETSTSVTSRFVLKVSIVAALGGLLFGYDTAVIAGAIGFLEKKFELSPAMVGWAASSAIWGCVFGAMFAGYLSDKVGRKKVLIITAVLFFVSSIGAAIPSNLTEFVLARFVGGLGIGAASMLSPLYISEIAPAKIRGTLVSLYQLAIVIGINLIYFVIIKLLKQVTKRGMWSTAGDTCWDQAHCRQFYFSFFFSLCRKVQDGL